MSEEKGINRISLRVPADLFESLDEKRFKQKTTFQDVGLQLLRNWLANEGTREGPREGPRESPTSTKNEQYWQSAKNAGASADIAKEQEGNKLDLTGLNAEQISVATAFMEMLRSDDRDIAPPVMTLVRVWRDRNALSAASEASPESSSDKRRSKGRRSG